MIRGFMMNKIYKVIWSKVKHAYIVVSELATRHSKSSTKKSAIKVTAEMVAMLCLLQVTPCVTGVQASDRDHHHEDYYSDCSFHYVSITPYEDGDEAHHAALPKQNYKNNGAQGQAAAAIGNGAIAQAYSTSIGAQAQADDMDSVSIGQAAHSRNRNSVAIGSGAEATGDNTTAIGYTAAAIGYRSVAIGDNAWTKSNYDTAIGAGAFVSLENSVAIGVGSSAVANFQGHDQLSKWTKESYDGVASVGRGAYTNSSGEEQSAIYRRITNVAGGAAAHDAVNVAQLQAAIQNIKPTGSFFTAVSNTDNLGVEYTQSDKQEVTVGDKNSASTLVFSGDKNITVSLTQNEQRTDIAYSLKPCIYIGNPGTRITIDGTQGYIDGLHNKKWIVGATVAHSGRAATEDQLAAIARAVDLNSKKIANLKPNSLTILKTTYNTEGDTVINFSDGSKVTVPKGAKGDTGKAGRDGQDGKSISISSTTQDNDGNTVIQFSDGKQVTVQKGAKGDTGKAGQDGKSISISSTTQDNDGNTVIQFSDGKQVIVQKGAKGDTGKAGQDGKAGRDGQDGKSISISSTNWTVTATRLFSSPMVVK
ncbi:hypothetical protein C3L55_04600 [Veillonellaceae bacterium M1-70]|nr:hypothetical protein [Veillonellaceae bacterium M1-70]